MQRTLTLQSAVTADAERVAQILIEVRSAFMPYARLAHSDDEVRAWVAGDLVPSGGTVVARFGDTTVGVMTTERIGPVERSFTSSTTGRSVRWNWPASRQAAAMLASQVGRT